jgi:hypothetical protein
MANPADPREEMQLLRLIETADVVLDALYELSKANKPTLYPPDMMGTPAQPATLDPFSKAEIQDATDFLVRLGVIEFAV